MIRPRFLNVSWGSGSSLIDRNRAEGRQRRRGQRFALEALEERSLLTVIGIPLPKVSGLPTTPSEITIAAGKAWFAETTGATSSIGMIDPADPTHPKSIPGIASGAGGITTTPDGNVWFTEPTAGKIGVLNTSNQAIQNYSLPVGPTPVPSGLTVAVDSHGKAVLWYTDPTNNAIGMFDPSNPNHPPAEIKLPNNLIGGIGSQIVAAPNGQIWFTEVKLDPTTFAVTASALEAYTPATGTWSSEVHLLSGQAPHGLTLGTDHNIWFGADVPPPYGTSGGDLSSDIGTINLSVSPLAATQTPIQPVPGGVTRVPLELVAGSDGAIWFIDNANSAVVAFDPASKSFTPFPAPTETTFGIALTGIASEPGSIWFTDATGAVDFATVDTKIAVTAQPPSVNVNTGFNVSVSVKYANTGNPYNGIAITAIASGPAGATLGPHTTVTATVTNGVATFTGLTLNELGSYTLTVAGGDATATTATINVVPQTVALATHLGVAAQPPGTVVAGTPFGLTVLALTAAGGVDGTYNGPVTVSMANNPGGATLGGHTTVNAVSGIATFTDLTLSSAGVGYVLSATSGSLILTSTTPITVTAVSQPPPAPPAAEITGQTVIFTQKTNKKGKKIGKPVLAGFQINFNTAMYPATTGNRANYSLGAYALVRVRVGKKFQKVLRLQPVGFSVTYSATNNSVTLSLIGKQTFLKGGQITLTAAPPGGISSNAGGLLDGNGDGTGGDNAIFNISTNARSISRA